MGDKGPANAVAIAKVMTEAGFDCAWTEAGLSSRASIRGFVARGQELGSIEFLINAAGVSPSQAPIETPLAIDEFNGPRGDFLIDGGATASYYYGPLQP